MKTVWILREDLMHICGVYSSEAKANHAVREFGDYSEIDMDGNPLANTHTYYVSEEEEVDIPTNL